MKFISFLIRDWRNGHQRKFLEQKSPAKHHPVSLTEQVNRFLQATYDFRYNMLTEETEYRLSDSTHEIFTPIGKRELNSLCLEAHAQGILCWDKDISRYLFSKTYKNITPSYFTSTGSPFGTALTGLANWHAASLPSHSG